jgi:hypothetical protein
MVMKTILPLILSLFRYQDFNIDKENIQTCDRVELYLLHLIQLPGVIYDGT